MDKTIRVLLITDEVWNDEVNGNNVLSNWFEGFNAEIAHIYCSPGQPKNKSCKTYFQITDAMMLRSIISKKKAGKAFQLDDLDISKNQFVGEHENIKLYGKLKAITTETLRAVREFIWSYGEYDLNSLKVFIDEFKPDIIFAPRMATLKMLRLEQLVHEIANVPIVAFTGDAEYSLRIFRLSPVFWIKRLILRRKFKTMMPNYSLYYTLSDEQKIEYEKEFGDKFKILRKTGDFSRYKYSEKTINHPIRIVYAGKLYSNRWRTLVEFAKAIKRINKNEQRIILEIYSRDKLTKIQNKLLNDGCNSFFMGGVAPDKLTEIYNKSDIALHVESFDFKNRLLTRVSFSTKIIDCLASGCAVLVASWDKHSGYTYLKSEDAAITIENKENIYTTLLGIVNDPNLICKYRKKAWICGKNNHQKGKIQQMLYRDFSSLINLKR